LLGWLQSDPPSRINEPRMSKSSGIRGILPVIALIFVLTGCGGDSGTAEDTTTSASSSSAGHVFVIVMENRNYDQGLAAPYTASLVSQYAVATDYHAVGHPSGPNYLALTSGSTWGMDMSTGDKYRALPSGEDLGSELTSAGIPWRAYMEDMGSDGCFATSKSYGLNHNPFAWYGGQCPSNVVDFSQLDADLSGDTPNFVWITPNNCNDTDKCSVSTGDKWLGEVVPKILDSEAWKKDGVLYVVWDEDDDKKSTINRVPLIVASPNLKSHQTDAHYDHYSLLATIEDQLGVGRTGEAANAQPIDDLLK
jgi:hypothetical protein